MLDGIALALPALVQAHEYRFGVARVGFEWPEISGVYEKIEEEIGEIKGAVTERESAAEVGDLLFAAVNLARWLKVEPESALREANSALPPTLRTYRGTGASVGTLSLRPFVRGDGKRYGRWPSIYNN